MSKPQSITAAGGVLYRSNSNSEFPQVVLIYCRQVWDLPKGKLEKNETIKECAVREVTEEINLSSPPQIVGALTDTYHEYEQKGLRYGKTTHWFAMEVEDWSGEKLEPETQEGIKKVCWYPLRQAIETVGYNNLIEVLDNFQDWYKENS